MTTESDGGEGGDAGERRAPEEANRLARLYLKLKWSLIPIAVRTKRPAEPSWKHRQQKRARLRTVAKWIQEGHGLGVVLGEVSGVVARDFDDEVAYRRWAETYPEAAATLPTSRTSRGYHVFLPTSEPVPTTTFDDGELRGGGTYVLLPPSIHATGDCYEWLREPDPAATTSLSAADAGLNRCWSSQPHTESTKAHRTSTEEHATASVDSEVFVDSVSPTQHEEIVEAIKKTVPTEKGTRNVSLFPFARRLKGILGRMPSRTLGECYARLWLEVGGENIATRDPLFMMVELERALRNVRVLVGGEGDPVVAAMERAETREKPSFMAKYDDSDPSVRLAKLVVELSEMHDGAPSFYRAGRRPMSCLARRGVMWMWMWTV